MMRVISGDEEARERSDLATLLLTILGQGPR